MRVVREYSAPKAVQKNLDPFSVKEIEGDFVREVTVFDPVEKVLTKTTVTEDRQFLVTFLKGHSIVFYTEDELNAAGFGEQPRLPHTDMVRSDVGDPNDR